MIAGVPPIRGDSVRNRTPTPFLTLLALTRSVAEIARWVLARLCRRRPRLRKDRAGPSCCPWRAAEAQGPIASCRHRARPPVRGPPPPRGTMLGHRR